MVKMSVKDTVSVAFTFTVDFSSVYGVISCWNQSLIGAKTLHPLLPLLYSVPHVTGNRHSGICV